MISTNGGLLAHRYTPQVTPRWPRGSEPASVLGHLAAVHRCARSVCCSACAVSWATRLLFTGVPTRCVPLLVRCPAPFGSCSPVCPRGLLCCVCGVLGNLARVHRCARPVCCLCVRCPGPLGSCSPVCPLGALLCICDVLGLLAPVHRCARSVRCFACAVSWAAWLLFTGLPVPCVALGVRCPWPLGSCSPVCPLGALPVCAVSWATWLVFTGKPARCVALRWRCPGPLGSSSPVCPRGLLCCVCGVLGHLAPVHRCARSVCCFACAMSWATWLLITGVPARCVALRVRCPGPLRSCSPVSPRGLFVCVCGALGHLAPAHRCARSVCCFACAVSWATSPPFNSVPARCLALRVRCPGPLGSGSLVCPLGALPVCAVSRAHWLLFTGVLACCVVVLVRCAGPLGSWSPVCALGALFCLCAVLGHLAPVHRCACWVCCVVCAVSQATWLLFTGVPARCVVVGVRCPGHLGSCSPVRSRGVLCGVMGHLAPVHGCTRSVCFAVGCACGASLLGARSSVRTAAIRSRHGLGTLRAHTHPSRRRLFLSRQGLGSLPGAHTSVRTAAGVAWHLSLCRGSLHVVRALRVCGTQWPSLLGTCPCAVVVAGGVPLWRPSWPRVVRRASSGPVALGAPVVFPNAVVPFPTPGACAPGFTGWLRGARRGRPTTGLIVPAAGPRRGRGVGLAPRRTRFRAPRWGCPWRLPPASVLGCLRCGGWRVWTRSLTRPVSRTVRRSTGDSAGAPGLLRVDADTSPCGSEDATPGSCACVRVLVRPGRVGRPASWAPSGAPLATLKQKKPFFYFSTKIWSRCVTLLGYGHLGNSEFKEFTVIHFTGPFYKSA